MTNQLEISRKFVTEDLVPKQSTTLAVYGIDPKKFASAVCECFLRFPQIVNCEKKSLAHALRISCLYGLQPDGRLAAVVPFQNKSGDLIATFLPMKDGLQKMIMRAFPNAHIESGLINACDDYEWSGGDDASFKVKKIIPRTKEDKDVIAAWCRVELEDGRVYLEVMDQMDLENARSASKARKPDAPWQKWYGSMCEKSVIKKMMNRLIYMIDSDEIRTVYTETLEADSDFKKEPQQTKKPVVIEADKKPINVVPDEIKDVTGDKAAEPAKQKTAKTTATKKTAPKKEAKPAPAAEPEPQPLAEDPPDEAEDPPEFEDDGVDL